MTTDEHIDVYRRYLKRFEEMFGEVAFDATVQHQGRLITKLRYDEFVAKYVEYKNLEDFLRDVMTRGATLSDDVNRMYRDLSAHVLETPKDFLVF